MCHADETGRNFIVAPVKRPLKVHPKKLKKNQKDFEKFKVGIKDFQIFEEDVKKYYEFKILKEDRDQLKRIFKLYEVFKLPEESLCQYKERIKSY